MVSDKKTDVEANVALLEDADKKPEDKDPLPWCRFFFIWVAVSCSSGILPGQAVFSRLFADAGVFGSVCEDGENGCKDQYVALSSNFQGATALTLFLMLPIGILFDCLGARTIGAIGALICAFGMFVVVGSIMGAQSGMDSSTSWLFGLGLLITDFGSFLNSFGTFGLVWHFPGHQTLFLALITATYQISAFFPIAIEFGMKHVGFTLAAGMAAWVVVVIIMAYVCWVTIPTQQEFFDTAKKVLGMPLPKPSNDPMCKLIGRAWEVLRIDMTDHIVCGLVIAIGYMLPGMYPGMLAPFGEALFGSEEDGDMMSNLYVWVNVVLGCVAAPVCGMFVDRFGILPFIYILFFLEAGASLTIWFADWTCQLIVMFCLVVWGLLFQLFLNRYVMLYSPPNRYGAVSGFFWALDALFAIMPMQFIGFGALSALPQGIDAYRYSFVACGALGSLATLLYALYFTVRPPPDMPRLLGNDEKDLAKNFGCENLEEVAYVTHSATKKEVMAKLVKQDAASVQNIIKSIDTERMIEMMNRRSAEDIAEIMDEAGEEEEEEEEAEAEETKDGEAVESAGGSKVEELIVPTELRRSFYEEWIAQDDAKKEDDPVADLNDRMLSMLTAKDKEGMRKAFMEEDVELLDKVFIYWEDNFLEAEQKKNEKLFNKLISNKEFAQMLRERTELKKLIQNMIRHSMDKRIAKFKGKKS